MIRNAQAVKKEAVIIPYSKTKMSIAEILSQEGFVKEAVKRGRKSRKILSITLKYGKNGESAISRIKRVSKPSQRVYAPLKQIRPGRSGRGLQILATSKGVLTSKQARKAKVGGEIICEVR